MCSWTDEETNRIFGLGSTNSNETNRQLTFVSVGKEVKIWQTFDRRQSLPDEDCVVVQPSVLPLYSNEVIDSGSSSSEDEDEESENERFVRRTTSDHEEVQNSYWRCQLL